MERWIGIIKTEDGHGIVAVQGNPNVQQRTTDSRAEAFKDIHLEVERAKMHGERFASLHEAYAVIFEELDELWEIARQKRRDRDAKEIRKELVQIAAMAIKGVESLDNFVGGSV